MSKTELEMRGTEKMPRILDVCYECESTDVEMLAWVDINTLKFTDDHTPPNSSRQDNVWCNNCKGHVAIKTVRTYNSLIT